MKFADALKSAVKMFSSTEFLKNIKEEDPTMIKHMELLKNINQLGFLTENSQAGRSRKGVRDGKRYEIKERAYLSGFMIEDHAKEFIKSMGILTDKNAVFVPVCCDDVIIPASLDLPVTITTKQGETSVTTHVSMALPKEVFDFLKKQVKLDKREKVVYILCWDTKWSRNAGSSTGLFNDVLKVLKGL